MMLFMFSVDEAPPIPLSPVRDGPKRKVSITERVLKSKNTEQQMQSITVRFLWGFFTFSFYALL